MKISKEIKNKKALELIDNISNTPRSGLGHPEQLRYKDCEQWSRKVCKYNRLVYSIDEINKTIVIASDLGHYGD